MRLIPARAGKTLFATKTASEASAHPRFRGENACPFVGFSVIMGSSPLARGKLVTEPTIRKLCGIIPACAGKTGSTTSPQHSFGIIPACAGKTPPNFSLAPIWPDHPCLRGENGLSRNTSEPRRGSSLLARGKPPISWVARVLIRIIPACAGKTECSYCTGDCQ